MKNEMVHFIINLESSDKDGKKLMKTVLQHNLSSSLLQFFEVFEEALRGW
jgi:hypothetical protein